MKGIYVKYIACICYCFFSSLSFATDCPQPVQPIKEGQVANCSGFIFSNSAESQAYKATRIVELQEKENAILEKRLELYVKQSEVLAKEIAKKNNTEDLYRYGMFGLGALLTGIIAASVNH